MTETFFDIRRSRVDRANTDIRNHPEWAVVSSGCLKLAHVHRLSMRGT